MGVQWLYSMPWAGCRCRFRRSAAAALEVLRAGQEESPEQERDAPVCPRCGGKGVESGPTGLLAALSLCLGIPLLARRRNRCGKCGATWR